ncbi:DUF695 domain-containing protein [Arenimonas alkanexedens]
MTPEPYYTVINTTIGKDPAVVVVNSALRAFRDYDAFPWHLRIGIECKDLGANGMPTNEEGKALHLLEDEITRPLQANNNAIFLARITARGERVLLFRVSNPETASDTLQALASESLPLREWDYHMEQDVTWELARPELQLLGKDPRFT